VEDEGVRVTRDIQVEHAPQHEHMVAGVEFLLDVAVDPRHAVVDHR
jgi:hypothetical protein